MSDRPIHERLEEQRWRFHSLVQELRTRWPRFEAADRTSPLANVCVALLSRIGGWLATLTHLDHPEQHAHAYAVAARFALEATVDLVLLLDDPKSLEKFNWWEQSAKLACADNWGPERSPPDVAPWLRANAHAIRQRRRAYWGKKGHPSRWTGNPIRDDVRTADASRKMFLTKSLDIIDQLNWYAHGSGVIVNVMNDDTHAEMAHISTMSLFLSTVAAIVLVEEAIGGPRAAVIDVAKLAEKLRTDAEQRQRLVTAAKTERSLET